MNIYEFLTGDQIEVIMRGELQDCLDAGDLDPALETAIILTLSYYSAPKAET
jgi:hypothetical protein